MSEPRLLLSGLGFPESTRWHDGRIWVCNWGAGEVLAATPDGDRDVVARLAADALPLSIDWLPDGRMLIVDGPRRRLLCRQFDGTLVALAQLGGSDPRPFNEVVADARGNAYVNGGAGVIALVAGDGSVREVADGLQWPNGMALLDDGRTLVIADSHACQLLGYDVAEDGALSGRRVWAAVEHAPDGICADAEGAVWVASVPGQRCTRVREGGEVVDAVDVDRGCFACMLGGADGRTLFIAAARWRGMQALAQEGPGETGQLLAVPGAPAPHAGRP